jgi:hypothetical protein
LKNGIRTKSSWQHFKYRSIRLNWVKDRLILYANGLAISSVPAKGEMSRIAVPRQTTNPNSRSSSVKTEGSLTSKEKEEIDD